MIYTLTLTYYFNFHIYKMSDDPKNSAGAIARAQTAGTFVKTAGMVLIAPIAAVVLIIIVIIIIAVVASSGFSNPINTLTNPSNGCRSNACRTTNYKRPLANPVRRLSNAPPRDIVGLSLHRSGKNMQKMNNDRAFSSANKASKLKFGQNVYDELTSY